MSDDRVVQIESDADSEIRDWPELVGQLNRLLRLRTTPIGMKLFETVEEMEKIPRIRRPQAIHTTDQVVAQAARLGWTVGITVEDLVGAQCGAVIGLHPRDDEWLSGKHMAGVWYDTVDDASAHQHAMDVVPYGRYSALAVSPLASGRLDPPDVCLIYATPGQMIRSVGSSGPATRSWNGAASGNLPVQTPGAVLWRPGSRACRSPALPSAATGGCSTTRCSWPRRRRSCQEPSRGWSVCPPTVCAIPFRSTGCRAMRGPVWARAMALAEAAS